MKAPTKAQIIENIKVKCKDANPLLVNLLISDIKRWKKDELKHVLKVVQVLPNGDISLSKTAPNKVIEGLFYDTEYHCTNCGEDTLFQIPKGVLEVDFVQNLVCLYCGCKYDTYCEDED